MAKVRSASPRLRTVTPAPAWLPTSTVSARVGGSSGARSGPVPTGTTVRVAVAETVASGHAGSGDGEAAARARRRPGGGVVARDELSRRTLPGHPDAASQDRGRERCLGATLDHQLLGRDGDDRTHHHHRAGAPGRVVGPPGRQRVATSDIRCLIGDRLTAAENLAAAGLPQQHDLTVSARDDGPNRRLFVDREVELVGVERYHELNCAPTQQCQEKCGA